MKAFNVTGLCVPEDDYMVDISGKIRKIKELIDSRSYFTINRARQYGKTTTLAMLKRELDDDYMMILISFEGLGEESFETTTAFCAIFTQLIQQALRLTSADEEYIDAWYNPEVTDFVSLSRHITKMCTDKKIVLMVDEVDKVSNNRVFLHFLSMLREKFLARKRNVDYTFHSVILTGVYDIKNIKLKLASEGLLASESAGNKIYNSPWNIAADFDVNMSFDTAEIATMLTDYEADYHTGMDISAISEEIYTYTSGYPYLVSRICFHIDKNLRRNWTTTGVQDAVKIMLTERDTLFDDVFKNLENNKELYDFTHSLLIKGAVNHYVIYDPVIETGVRYAFFINRGGKVAISNKIFELLMTAYFVSIDTRKGRMNSKQGNVTTIYNKRNKPWIF